MMSGAQKAEATQSSYFPVWKVGRYVTLRSLHCLTAVLSRQRIDARLCGSVLNVFGIVKCHLKLIIAKLNNINFVTYKSHTLRYGQGFYGPSSNVRTNR